MVDNGIPSNTSQQYLVVSAEQTYPTQESTKRNETAAPTGLKLVTCQEWATVMILFYVNLINYMDRFTVAGSLTEIQTHFGIKPVYSGLLQTVFIISYMICAPLFGYLGDRYNRKIIMSFGVFLWCLTTLIGSFLEKFGWFLLFRAFVGIGEASYSTIAPTIISDLFVKDVRSKMLALFYFAIPVGSGLGYMIGDGMTRATGDWRWGLRVTPVLGLIAILLLLTIRDPIRGEREGGQHFATTNWSEDIKTLLKNPSFMLSTGGFTCVAFVAGALAWWGPTCLEKGFSLLSDGKKNITDTKIKFGIVSMMTGLLGVSLGSYLAQKLRVRWQPADPVICAVGLLISAPMLFFACIAANKNEILCYVLIFFGQLSLNLNWAIVADMLLYVVVPSRRSTAEAFQILFAHTFGDAGSPYLIGLLSSLLMKSEPSPSGDATKVDPAEFYSLRNALFLTIFVDVLGSLFFFLTALYIEKDRAIVDLALMDHCNSDTARICSSKEEIESEPQEIGNNTS